MGVVQVTTNDGRTSAITPPSPTVQQLLDTITVVAAQPPADLPGGQALADAAALLAGMEALRPALLCTRARSSFPACLCPSWRSTRAARRTAVCGPQWSR